jgi:hypothetical protein
MTEETPDRPKRRKMAKPLAEVEPLLDPAPAELPVEAIAESIPDIEPEIESESIPDIEPEIESEPVPDIQQEILQVLPKPKGKYNTEFYKAIGIPVCPFCGDKESLACSEGKTDCPMLQR